MHCMSHPQHMTGFIHTITHCDWSARGKIQKRTSVILTSYKVMTDLLGQNLLVSRPYKKFHDLMYPLMSLEHF